MSSCNPGVLSETNQLVNPFHHFVPVGGSLTRPEPAWPRGFPLVQIHGPNYLTCPADPSSRDHAVIHSLANPEADLDALYRLVHKNRVKFKIDAKPLILGKNEFSPFNGQSTMWFEKVYRLMFLPTTVDKRVSDIWRSFILEYFGKLTGGHVVFTRPYVIRGNESPIQYWQY